MGDFRWNVQIAVHLGRDMHVPYHPHSSPPYFCWTLCNKEELCSNLDANISKSGYELVSVWASLEGPGKGQEKCLPMVVSTGQFQECAFSGWPSKLTIHAQKTKQKTVCFRGEVKKGFLIVSLPEHEGAPWAAVCVSVTAGWLRFTLSSLASLCVLPSLFRHYFVVFIFNVSLLNLIFLEFFF